MEYLYTGAVQGVTARRLDIDKLQAALLAAEFLHVDESAQDAQDWAVFVVLRSTQALARIKRA
jgi:hypothetical protein